MTARTGSDKIALLDMFFLRTPFLPAQISGWAIAKQPPRY